MNEEKPTTEETAPEPMATGEIVADDNQTEELAAEAAPVGDETVAEEAEVAAEADVAEEPAAEVAPVAAAEDTAAAEEAPAEPAAATAAPKNPRFGYYVVHTYSMFEEKAKSALLERVKMNKMDDYFGDIIVPKTATETTLKSGKKKRVEKTSFPGYIIVEMDLNEQTNHLVTGTPKITGFVGNARKPRPISDQEVLRLTSPEVVQEQKQQQASNLSFEKGETVKVIDGAFTNFDGLVEAVQPDKMKLRILVSIFGRETPVELDYGQVEKLS